MGYNGNKTRVWDNTTRNFGTYFNDEFDRLYENSGYLKTRVADAHVNGFDYPESSRVRVGGVDYIAVRDVDTQADGNDFPSQFLAGAWLSIGQGVFESDETFTVGSGGDYPNITDALLDVSRKTPIFKPGGITVELKLLSGFVMEEQVFVSRYDLSFVKITSEDAQVDIDANFITQTFLNQTSAFTGDNCVMPRIEVLFNMINAGTTENGYYVKNSRGEIASGAGFKNAGSFGIRTFGSSTINANGADVSGAGDIGMESAQGSIINADGADASGAVQRYGIRSIRSGTINFQGGNASGAGSVGIHVSEGSTINAKDATGTLSQSANTLTSNGIIYQ